MTHGSRQKRARDDADPWLLNHDLLNDSDWAVFEDMHQILGIFDQVTMRTRGGGGDSDRGVVWDYLSVERGGRFDGLVRSALGINTLALLVVGRLSIFTQSIQTSLPSERSSCVSVSIHFWRPRCDANEALRSLPVKSGVMQSIACETV